ncbi:rod shape-determining protein MreC [Moraxellaceae bacterium AER2_44_116]|jgi:rod shape-determining protein MreC|nr:rod shape-determining protein MreC [Moraxellaceae bacterium AER2_44_116]
MSDIGYRTKRRFDDIPAGGYRLVLAVLCASALTFFDSRYAEQFQQVRHESQQLLEPLNRVLSYPNRLVVGLSERLRTQKSLYEENKILQASLLQTSVQLQQLAESRAENTRLRALLDSTLSINDHILNAEIISIDPNPNHRVFTLNKGLREGITVGLPVLDAKGIMGQIVESTERLSSLMLISDSRHSIPVRVGRTGDRAILTGMGDNVRLRLDYMPESADIKVGDELVTSGLGDSFPAGYPVAMISDVKRQHGSEFTEAYAKPIAELDSSRHVIVLFRRSLHDEQPVIAPEHVISETNYASP